MDQPRSVVQQPRWKTVAQDGLPVLGSTFLLALAVLTGLMMFPS